MPSPIIPTPEVIRAAYIEQISRRNPNAEAFVQFAETELTAFIRKYEDTNFKGIYTCLEHGFYDRVRNKIANNKEMRKEDEAADSKYSLHLKLYSGFLESKAFKNIIKPPKTAKSAKPVKPVMPKERIMTEGEKKHVEFETANRNPKLRQACIDKYGYQCQCCGMNFADMYGEELGAQFIEVHHLKMISTYDEQKPEDYLENLVPLCSNCHSMIHHGKDGPLTLRELREAYRGEKKPLAVCKED